MRTIVIALAAGATLSACAPRITVNPGDTTPPAVTVSLVSPGSLNARYDGGEAVAGVIDPARLFRIEPRSDAATVSVLAVARDDESGVSLVQLALQMTFTCNARVLGGPVTQASGATFAETASERTPPGGETSADRGVGVSFRVEDLWRQGRCTEWGQVTQVNQGSLTNIQVEYTVQAVNNTAPATGTTWVRGRFTIADATVAL